MAAPKAPQASAMKRSDPSPPAAAAASAQASRLARDGGERGGAGGEALVSPDGTVTEAPRTVKKHLSAVEIPGWSGCNPRHTSCG
ncbi:UNVERIFIED_CONTAM: hypothetical protein K2H54_077278 [Gekko kuhli]